MDLYRIVVVRKGWPIWDGEQKVGAYLNGPLATHTDAEKLKLHKKERKSFLKKLPTISRVTNHVPTPEEQALGIGLRTEYVVRSEWEKNELLTWFNQTLAAKVKHINPTLSQSAQAFRI